MNNRIGTILYPIVHAGFYTLARLLLRLRVIGSHHIPETGGVLVAANHASYADIPLIGCAMKRRASFIGKEELFRNPVMGWMYRTMGGVPIKRFHSRDALGEAIRRLESGQLVIIYPEGARSLDGHLGRGMPGIGILAAITGVPVVPVCITGTHKVLPVGSKWIRLHPVIVLFGKPIDFKDLTRQSGPSKELYRMISERVMAEIRALAHQAESLEKEMRGEAIAGKI